MKSILFLAATATLAAAPPTLVDISPHGAQRGKSFTLYLRGDALPPDARIETTLPAAFSRLIQSKDPARPMRGAALPFLVTVKPDAPVGLYPIRVATDSGISNVLLFSVGDLPEIEEAETKPQKVAAPIVINGKLVGPDVDRYTFHAAAGQKLVFEVEARRVGSAIDPALEIYDASGREIARNDDVPGLGVDSRLEVAFPKTGDYTAAIHDSKFSDQAQNFYRLKIARYDFADAIFPLGGPKGTEVTLSGGNLAQPVRLKADGPWIRLPGSHSLPIAFAVSEQPEYTAAGASPFTLEAGRIANGRIARAGQIDRYRLAVEPGQSWVFEIAAASLGTSRLDAILTAFDAQGKKLASSDDGNGFDPLLDFTVPDGLHEITLAVEDLLGRGGDAYGYRLAARKQHPDFVATLLTPFVNVPAGGTARVNVLIQRRGYAGEIRVRIPNLPEGFQLAGGHVAAESASQDFKNETPGRKSVVSALTITAPANAKPQASELRVVAEARTEDGRIVREATGPGMITAIRGDKQKSFVAPWLGMSLPMAITDPSPFTISPGTLSARFAQGFEFDMQYEIKRNGGTRGPLQPKPAILSAVGNLRILKGTAGKGGDKGSYQLDTNFATPFATCDMAFDVQTEIDGKPVSVTSPIFEVQIVPGYQVTLARNEIEIDPGGKLAVAGRVHREPTFEGGLIKLQAEDLPDHVSCPAVEVPEDQKEFTLQCSADAAAKPGAFPIRISSVAPNTGRKAKADYKIPDIEASLRIGPTKLAAGK